ncbi:MAG: polymorphic toxin type 50 domain-containing protein [Oscillospiraceae bacterium]|nr:polymorphic toxin type 50 domain-containing protein [Oscillospiraceae bacterium]
MGADEGKIAMQIVNKAFDIEAERRKILDGTYPSRIIQGRQNKHIEGTTEFEQNCEKLNRLSPGSKPAILDVDAQTLLDKYKGTGRIDFVGSEYPREYITSDVFIGRTWYKEMAKYVDTKRFMIIYSSTGTHVVPVSDYVG